MILEASNTIALVSLFCSMTVFYIRIYGNKDKLVHRWKWVGHWSLKLAFIFMIAGAMFCLLSFHEANLAQTILNLGMALITLWASMFHAKLFKGTETKSE